MGQLNGIRLVLLIAQIQRDYLRILSSGESDLVALGGAQKTEILTVDTSVVHFYLVFCTFGVERV